MDAGRVVLVHDWLTGMRGGEKCLEPLARRWPAARLLTLLHTRGSVSPAIERLRVRPSLLTLPTRKNAPMLGIGMCRKIGPMRQPGCSHICPLLACTSAS